MAKKIILMLILWSFVLGNIYAQDLVLRGGTILTITKGTIQSGMILIRNGKIIAIGKVAPVPPDIQVVDVSGYYVMPGIIDSHSHIALEDVNEATDPVTPQIWMRDAIDPSSDSIQKTLAGGVTTVKIMHGSANVIGGVNVTLKLKYGCPLDEMIITGVRQQLKLALGENPIRFHGKKGRPPSTRMGNAYVLRKAFIEAQEYKAGWDKYERDKRAKKNSINPPPKDQKLETLKMVLEGKMGLDCHVYRAEEIVWIINFCREYGVDLKQLSHCVDGYKVADVIAQSGASYGGWVDSWGFKEEAYDGCPYGIKIMHDAGVNIVINSDDDDECRYLNLNAAKILKYNDIPEEDILKMITLNPAKALDLEDRVGSLEPGKDGDIAVFDKHPLDSTSKCIMTIIEGKIYFDYAKEHIAAKENPHE